MKTGVITVTLAFLLLAFQCEDDPHSKSGDPCTDGHTPAWIGEIIDGIKSNGWEGEIIRYKYHDQYVYVID